MADLSQKPLFLVGKKTVLRPVSKSDIPLLWHWINDPEVREFVSHDLPNTEKQEEEWVNTIGSDDKNIVLIIETNERVPIGVISLNYIKWRDRVATTGTIIGEKQFWNKGYGTDAKMILLDYAFNTLNLHKICSAVIDFNKRSLRYSLHCGYKIEGTRKRHIFKKGRYRDLIELGLFKEDWLPYWKKYLATKTAE